MKKYLVFSGVVCVLSATLLLVLFAFSHDREKRESVPAPPSSGQRQQAPVETSPVAPHSESHSANDEKGVIVRVIVRDHRGEIVKDPIIDFTEAHGPDSARMRQIKRTDDHTWRLAVKRPGYLFVKAFLSRESNAGAQLRVDVAADDPSREIELTFPRTSALQGVIRGKAGAPVGDAEVQVWLADPDKSRLFPDADNFDSRHPRMTTGADGTYEFERLISGYEERRKGFRKVESGMVYHIKVTHRDHYDKIDQCVIGGDEATVRNILLVPKGLDVLKGIVYGENGQVVAGAEVCYLLDISGGAILEGYKVPSNAKTNALGEFDLDIKGGMVNEKMTLKIMAKGHRLFKMSMTAIQRSNERTPFHLEPGKMIAGRICDEDHNPLKYVKVFLAPSDEENKLSSMKQDELCRSTFTDENGRYEVASLEDIPYDVLAHIRMFDDARLDQQSQDERMSTQWEKNANRIDKVRPDNHGVDFVFRRVK